jgi:hypothetical protein
MDTSVVDGRVVIIAPTGGEWRTCGTVPISIANAGCCKPCSTAFSGAQGVGQGVLSWGAGIGGELLRYREAPNLQFKKPHIKKRRPRKLPGEELVGLKKLGCVGAGGPLLTNKMEKVDENWCIDK